MTEAILKRVNETAWAIHQPALEAALARLQAGTEPPEAAQAAPGRTASGVAVVPIRGTIRQRGPEFMSFLFGGAGASTEAIISTLRQLVVDESIGSIILDIDSPGGTVYGVAELADEVFKMRGSKPIVAVANSQAFSAAYWIGSQADQLIVTPGGEVGSIGVWTLHADFSGMNERMGVDFTYISAGKFKVAGNEDEPLSDEARELIQASVDRYYSLFVNAVARGRGVKAAEVRSGFGEGWIVGAKEAVQLGMADRVATLRETVARLAGGRRGAGARAEDDSVALTEQDCIDAIEAKDDEPQPAAMSPEDDLDLRKRRARALERAG